MIARLLYPASDPDLGALCALALTDAELECQPVASLEEALAQASHGPSLVMLSLRDSEMHGLSELLSQNPALAVIAVGTGNSLAEGLEAMRRGARDFLPRPLRRTALRRAVQRWLEQREQTGDAAQLSERLALMELGRTLTSTLQLDELYEQIIEQVQRVFRPDTVSLMLLTDEGEGLRLVAQRGLPSHVSPKVKLEGSIAGQVVRERRPLLLLGGLEGTPFANRARRNRIASAMSIPLLVKRETLGVLNVNRYQGSPNYTENDANLLHVYAAQIAIALKNAQLYENLRDERDRILKAQEDVRRDLARDLHDGLAQVLATLAISLDHMGKMVQEGRMTSAMLPDQLEFLQLTTRQAIHDARTVIFGLRPLILETQGLVAALEHYIATLRDSNRRTRFHLQAEQFPSAPMAPKVARMTFAILQEAINNARKHARAQNIWVKLRCEPDGDGFLVRATVRDDGQGFDLPKVEGNYAKRYSFGLLNMRERAALIEATLGIDSGSQGTTIHLEVPWREGEVEEEMAR